MRERETPIYIPDNASKEITASLTNFPKNWIGKSEKETSKLSPFLSPDFAQLLHNDSN